MVITEETCDEKASAEQEQKDGGVRQRRARQLSVKVRIRRQLLSWWEEVQASWLPIFMVILACGFAIVGILLITEALPLR